MRSVHQQWAFGVNWSQISQLFLISPNNKPLSLSWASGVSNEARFVFTVQSIIMPQKLKGTLTFIVKVSRETYSSNHAYQEEE